MGAIRRLATCWVENASENGFRAVAVSHFDHWLSEAEFCDDAVTPFLNSRAAFEGGFGAPYLEIERRFTALLDRLAVGGVFVIQFPERLKPIGPGGARYRALVRRGLRRERVRNDLYFPSLDARWIFNWDLTHWVILHDPARLADLTALVEAAGLHVLAG